MSNPKPDESANLLPSHIAIIMDGNGRWAEEHGLSRLEGHEEGANSVVAMMKACNRLGINCLSLFAFSTENWKRPKHEVEGLMRLLVRFLKDKSGELHKNKIRLRTMGELKQLPSLAQAEIERVVAETACYKDHTLNLAMNYGSRMEIARAARLIAQKVESGTLESSEISPQTVTENLYLPELSDPDLLIRTSGEMRLSNFLLWQLSYTELYFTDTYWPDFREAELEKAIQAYQQRNRRFGAHS